MCTFQSQKHPSISPRILPRTLQHSTLPERPSSLQIQHHSHQRPPRFHHHTHQVTTFPSHPEFHPHAPYISSKPLRTPASRFCPIFQKFTPALQKPCHPNWITPPHSWDLRLGLESRTSPGRPRPPLQPPKKSRSSLGHRIPLLGAPGAPPTRVGHATAIRLPSGPSERRSDPSPDCRNPPTLPALLGRRHRYFDAPLGSLHEHHHF